MGRLPGNVIAGMDCRDAELGLLAERLGPGKSKRRCQMNLLSWRVFSMALLLAIAVAMPAVVKAQDAQPMSQIKLGSSSTSLSSGSTLSSDATTTSTLDGDQGSGGITDASTTGPEAAAFDGTYVWVATQFSDSITRIRVKDGLVSGTFAVGKRPVALLYAASYLWVANLQSNNVMKITPSTGALVATYAAGDGPGALAYDGRNIWVANRNSNNVTKLSTTGSNLGTFAVGKRPMGVAYFANSVWVTNNFSNSVRSEEHTSELQSPCNLVCRLLLEKTKQQPTHVCR